MIKRGRQVAFVLIVILMFVMPQIVLGQADPMSEMEKVASDTGQDSVGSLTSIITKIIKAILGASGFILLLLFIYSGFTWMTAGGNEEKVKKAKNTLKNAVIGLLIVVLAWVVIDFVITHLLRTVDPVHNIPPAHPEGGGIM